MANAAKSEGLRNLREAVGLKSRVGRILASICRFALDSAVLESLGGINAGKVKGTKLMQEGLKDRAHCVSLNDNNGPGDLKVGLNDIPEIMEKGEEELNKVTQEHERSVKRFKNTVFIAPPGVGALLYRFYKFISTRLKRFKNTVFIAPSGVGALLYRFFLLFGHTHTDQSKRCTLDWLTFIIEEKNPESKQSL